MGSNGKHGSGKGDKYRPVDSKVCSENWDMIFNKKKKKKKDKSK